MTDDQRRIVECRFCGIQREVCQHIEVELRRLWNLSDAYGLLLVASVKLMAEAEILSKSVLALPLSVQGLSSIRRATEGVSGARDNLARVLVNEPWKEDHQREETTLTSVHSPPREEPQEQPDDLKTVDGARSN